MRYIGLSNYAAWQIMKGLGISERQSWSRFESVQAYYSIAGRELEREIVPCARSAAQHSGVEPAGGRLVERQVQEDAAGPEGARRTTFDFPPSTVRARFAWSKRCARSPRHTASPVARVALAWVLHQPGITSVIVGAKSLEQLRDNIAAADLQLAQSEIARSMK